MTRFVCLAIAVLCTTASLSTTICSAQKPSDSKRSLGVAPAQQVHELHNLDTVPPYWYWMQPRDDQSLSLKYVDGAAHIRHQGSGTVWFFRNIAADASADWDLTLRVKATKATGQAGPGLHLRSRQLHYMFIVSPIQQSYWVGHFDGASNQWKTYVASEGDFQSYIKSSHIKGLGELNVLSVRKHGEDLDFVINGVVVKTFNIPNTLYGLSTSIDGMGFDISQPIEAQVLDVEMNYKTRAIAYDPTAFIGATKTYANELNADLADRYAVMAPNGSSIYWIRTAAQHSDNIMIASKETDSTWTNIRDAGFPLNNSDPNNVIAVSQDDNSLLLWGRYRGNGQPEGAGFSRSTRTATGWSVPTNVSIANYFTRASTREECVSADRTVAILACQRDDSYGDKDLYISFLQPDGSYSAPRNMGPRLNSEFTDGMPHLAADNKTLYFGSSRPGFGEHDIWVSKRLDSTWLSWTMPVNLGPTINSNGWNGYLTVHPSGKYAYMNTTGPYKSGIFRLKLPQDPASRKLLPDPTVLVRGRVLNAKTLKPIATTVAIATLPDKKNTAKAASEPSEGRYSIVLPGGESYGFYASEPGYFPVSDNLDITTLDLYREIERDLLLWPIEVGATVRLNNVFFDTNKSDLRGESREELQRLIAMLRERPTMKIELGGHTDDRASAELNNKLSAERAEAVQTFLVSQGIDASRLKAKGYGKTKPVAKGTSEAARQANRRVEFTIASI